MIVIDIKNPQELAERESRAAKALGRLAPDLIKRKVEEKVVERLKESFSEQGIDSHISIQDTEDSF